VAPPRISHYPIDWGKYPSPDRIEKDAFTGKVTVYPDEGEGPRAVKIVCDVVGGTVLTVDLGNILSSEIISNVQSVKLDNSSGANPLTVASVLTGDSNTIFAGAIAILPWDFTISDNKFTVSRADTGTVTVWLYNMPKPAIVWESNISVNAGAVSIADGADVAEGATAAAAYSDATGAAAGTVVGILKGLYVAIKGSLSVVLGAGAAIIGKVGIDQTTPGTTNGVAIGDGASVTLGAKADAAITNPANAGTLMAFIKGLLTQINLWVPTSSTSASIKPVVSTALETGHVLKNAAGNLYGLNVSTTTAAGRVLIHDAAAVPGAGAVTPIRDYPIAAGQSIDLTFEPPLQCITGISVSFSTATTPFTQTNSATAFFSGQVV